MKINQYVNFFILSDGQVDTRSEESVYLMNIIYNNLFVKEGYNFMDTLLIFV